MKINCIYHLSNQITNFCRNKHCLMPLCPECISEHSQYHEQQRSRPQYTTLNEIVADTQVQISNYIDLLAQDQARNGTVITKIKDLSGLVRDKVVGLKERVIRTVEEAFVGLEKDVIKVLEKMHEEKGLYSLEKSQKQDKVLVEQLDQLECLKNNLKGERGLSNLIYFMRDKQKQIDEVHAQLSSYLHVNENYQPQIEVNSEVFYSIDAILSRALKVGDKELGGRKKVLTSQQNRLTPKRSTPMKAPVQVVIPPSSMNSTASKLRDRGYAPFVESELRGYSPQISRARNARETEKEKGERSHLDGEYEKLTKKVAMIRQENDRLSRVLTRN